MELFAAAFAPFTTALVVMAMIAALELVGLLFGVAFSGLVDGMLPEIDLDADIDADIGGDVSGDVSGGGDALGNFLAWLYVGRVPVLILFAALLACFGLSGIFIQQIAAGVLGAPLPLLLAVPAAIAAALPLTRVLAGGLARILPKEESDAVSDQSFVGAVAEIIRGEARKGAPAEAKLTDGRGQTHYILVEPEGEAIFANGAKVVLVEKHGATFVAIPAPLASLSAQTS